MSTSAYYTFISAADKEKDATVNGCRMRTAPNTLDRQRETATSPSSFVTSSTSNSNSSLNQLNSSTPTSPGPPSAESNASTSSAFASSTSSSASAINNTAASLRLVTLHPLFPPSQKQPTRLVNNGNHNRHSLAGQLASFNCATPNPRESLRRSSATPTQSHRHNGFPLQMSHSYTLHSLEPKPLKPFKSNSAYLEAMKEDLAEWLNRLYPDLELTTENFFPQLENGVIICRHANNVTRMGREHLQQDTQKTRDEDEIPEQNNNLCGREGRFSSKLPTLIARQNQNYGSYTPTNAHSLSLPTQPNFTRSSPSVSHERAPIDWLRVRVLPYKKDAIPGTFFARDNICQFILWCRSLNIMDCLLFETDDLVARKNEKSFILCLLEVARIGFKVGMPTPLIIQLEQEIDREIENDAILQRNQEEAQEKTVKADTLRQAESELEASSAPDKSCEEAEEEEEDEDEELDYGPKPQVITNDLLSLHEKVVQLLCQCTCPTQFQMVRIGDGKYKVGDKLIIFVRILRRHIMVRVGGGWQELSEFLRLKDPCRARHPTIGFNTNSGLGVSQQNINNPSQSTSNHHRASVSDGATFPGSGQQSPHSMTPLTGTAIVSRSRLAESSHNLTATNRLGHTNGCSGIKFNGSNSSTSHCNNNNNHSQKQQPFRGQRLISSSASMSWLSQHQSSHL